MSRDRRARVAAAGVWALAAALSVMSGGCGDDSEPAAAAMSSRASSFDIVIAGGRVVDPESDVDGVRNVGIRAGRVEAVTTEALVGTEEIDARGLVVAPGFIDLHAHGQDPASRAFQARDGVTTALELEIGVFPVERWYTERSGQALINYGASVSHQAARLRAMHSVFSRRNAEGTFTLGAAGDGTLYRQATDEELDRMMRLIEGGLDEGGLGIGVGLSYTPGASHAEVLGLFELAARRATPLFIHLRSAGDFRRGGALAPFQEVIANAAVTGASVHVVHMNSSAGSEAAAALRIIRGARAQRIDVTTEAYPYNASASLIESPLFDEWVDQPDERYASLQWVATGERLTRETFEQYRRQGGWVIMHGGSEDTTEWIVAQPDVMTASDGIPFSEGRAHPRGAGTFSRVLGVYVRERGVLSLMDAVRKMTLLPARRLEPIAPGMSRKGRVQVGADADLTIFDAERIVDRATYEAPDQPSAGIVHVLVGGTFVVRDSALVDGTTPGRPVRGVRAP